jgi:hypothetical protein
MRYFIEASVRGGVTGPRKSFLKDHEGRRREFTERQLAESEATRLELYMNRDGALAQFSYKVKPC